MTTNSYHLDNVVEIFFETAYTAKSGGTPTYDGSSNTCKNVSCHGGQTTPSWLTGSIDVNTNCTLCHAYGTTQYNSYFSGHHSFHLTEVGTSCTECHDTNNLATVHFTNLSSTTMTTAYQKIKSTLHYTGTGGGIYGTCTLVDLPWRRPSGQSVVVNGGHLRSQNKRPLVAMRGSLCAG
jgi:predicted CxxxxCH...CXXCH cytochrome family protein